jgi:hypothetical protein
MYYSFLHQLTDRHDIAEILFKVALNTKNQTINPDETDNITKNIFNRIA